MSVLYAMSVLIWFPPILINFYCLFECPAIKYKKLTPYIKKLKMQMFLKIRFWTYYTFYYAAIMERDIRTQVKEPGMQQRSAATFELETMRLLICVLTPVPQRSRWFVNSPDEVFPAGLTLLNSLQPWTCMTTYRDKCDDARLSCPLSKCQTMVKTREASCTVLCNRKVCT